MATIKKHTAKDGKVTYNISIFLGRDGQDKKLYKHVTYTPKAKTPKAIEKEVNRYADDLEKIYKDHEIGNRDQTLLRDYIEEWQKHENFYRLSVSIQEQYLDIVNRRLVSACGYKQIGKITQQDIKSILRNMERDEHLSARTIRTTFKIFNSVFKTAKDDCYIVDNPCDNYKGLPTIHIDDKIQFFTPDQVKIFFEALDKEYSSTYSAHKRLISLTGESYSVSEYTETRKIPFQFKVYFYIAIYSGFRRGEMIGLKWSDIDFDHRLISIKRSVSKTKAQGQIEKSPKTDRSKRSIILPDVCFDLLEEWRSQQKKMSLELGSAWQGKRGSEFNENSIFITEFGDRMDLDTPTHKFGEIIDMYNKTVPKDQQLPKIRLHDLRHTNATLLLKELDVETVAKRLGHSKASTTLDFYGHALPEMDDVASKTLERLLA